MKFRLPRPKLAPLKPYLPDGSDVLTWIAFATIAAGVGMIYLPAGVIFAGLALLYVAYILGNSSGSK